MASLGVQLLELRAELHAARRCGEGSDLCQGGGRHPDRHHAEDRAEAEGHQGHRGIISLSWLCLKRIETSKNSWEQHPLRVLALASDLWSSGSLYLFLWPWLKFQFQLNPLIFFLWCGNLLIGNAQS